LDVNCILASKMPGLSDSKDKKFKKIIKNGINRFGQRLYN